MRKCSNNIRAASTRKSKHYNLKAQITRDISFKLNLKLINIIILNYYYDYIIINKIIDKYKKIVVIQNNKKL